MNLSEKHLAWFGTGHLPLEDENGEGAYPYPEIRSQAGEGTYQRDAQANNNDYGYDNAGYDNGYEDDYREPQQATTTYGSASKIINHPSVGARHRTMIYQLSTYEDSKDVIDDLLEGHSVLINLESLALEEAQRIIDTLIGACYAINATIKKAAAQTYLLAPETVEVAGTYADDNRSSTIFEDGRN